MEVRRGEYLALHRDGEGDVADLADAQPGDGLRQRDHRRAARVQRGVRDAHHLAGQRHVALDEARQFRGAGVRGFAGERVATREAHDFGSDLRRRREIEGALGDCRIENAFDLIVGWLDGSVHAANTRTDPPR